MPLASTRPSCSGGAQGHAFEHYTYDRAKNFRKDGANRLSGSPTSRRLSASARWNAGSSGLRPNLMPLAIARLRPLPVRSRDRKAPRSATPGGESFKDLAERARQTARIQYCMLDTSSDHSGWGCGDSCYSPVPRID
jgi:hypothetical protein